jgi:hypothetical protein
MLLLKYIVPIAFREFKIYFFRFYNFFVNVFQFQVYLTTRLFVLHNQKKNFLSFSKKQLTVQKTYSLHKKLFPCDVLLSVWHIFS